MFYRFPIRRPVSTTLALLLLAAPVGCSFSYSSASLSKSSKGISKSVSASSASVSGSSSESSKTQETRYREDVEAYTEAWVSAGADRSESDFLGGIAGFAQKRGISDWESDAVTWEGIGRGLGRAKLSKASFEGYQRSWAAGDPRRMELIQRGYDARR
jgi:hypothetical protein